MAELVDAADSKSVFARSGSSSLPRGTILRKTLIIKVFFFACRKDRGLRQLLQKLRAPSPVAVDEHREATSGCEAVVNHTQLFSPPPHPVVAAEARRLRAALQDQKIARQARSYRWHVPHVCPFQPGGLLSLRRCPFSDRTSRSEHIQAHRRHHFDSWRFFVPASLLWRLCVGDLRVCRGSCMPGPRTRT